jgi:staphylococcal nuclease domain-containing protein 1
MEKTQEGLVKGVFSGDHIVISGKIKKGSNELPEEKVLYLSLIQSPRVANSNNSSEEEAFGWDSRDFLRQKVLGNVVKYTLDYKNNDKSFGQVFLKGVNINVEMVQNGFAKIGFISKNNEVLNKSEFGTTLKTAENEARKLNSGIWTTDDEVLAQHRRNIVTSTDSSFDADLFLKNNKGKKLEAVLDYVINATCLTVYLKESQTYIKISLKYMAIPSSKDEDIYKSGKAYMERRYLHKDVIVTLHSSDTKGFIADLSDTRGCAALNILKQGYTKHFFGQSKDYTQEEHRTFNEAQSEAKKQKLRVWKNVSNDDLAQDEEKEKARDAKKSLNTADLTFQAEFFQVHSGDSMSVRNKKTGEIHRIFLSHLKAPKLAKHNSNEKDEPWAWQAREFIRKVLVGKTINCEFDYCRVMPKDGSKMNFYTVWRNPGTKDAGEALDRNLNVEILEHGYAAFITPRGDDEMSKHFDSYMTAEKASKENKKGLNSTKAPAVSNYTDMIGAGANKEKKKTFKSTLEHQKAVPCVIEYCFSSTKFKLRLDRHNCYIPFSLLGVKTVNKDANNTELHNKIFNSALEYVNNNTLQREATCDIMQADRVGNYFGYLTIKGKSFATSLLSEGFAVVSESSRTKITKLPEFKKAEIEAETKKKNIWNYEALVNSLKDTDGSYVNTSFTEKHADIKVRVTDYIDMNNFFVNIMPNKSLTAIDEVLNKYSSGQMRGIPLMAPISKNLMCVAKYPVDDMYYRAKITAVLKDDKFEVELIDFGTVEIVPLASLIKLDGSIAQYERQAILCEMAYLKFSVNTMKKTLDKFPDFVDIDLEEHAKLCYTYNPEGREKMGLLLNRGMKKNANSYHNDIIKVALAKFDSKKKIPDYMKDLVELDLANEAKNLGVWADNTEEENDDQWD